MIDLKSNRNFISRNLLGKLRKRLIIKKQSYKLEIVNNIDINPEGKIIQEVNLGLHLPQHNELIILDIIKQMNHNIILRILWLRKHNPDIYWNNNIINFWCNCIGYKSKEISIIKL